MKLKNLLAVGLAAALGTGLLPARVWTSSDGSKTFEGVFKSYDKESGQVTVILRSGKTITFGQDKLSEKDKEFLTSQADEAPGGGEDVEAQLKEQGIGSKITKRGILQKLDGKKFKDHDLAKAPEYYILYFSASW